MKGTYYKTPIDFKALIEKRDLANTILETSKNTLYTKDFRMNLNYSL